MSKITKTEPKTNAFDLEAWANQESTVIYRQFRQDIRPDVMEYIGRDLLDALAKHTSTKTTAK